MDGARKKTKTKKTNAAKNRPHLVLLYDPRNEQRFIARRCVICSSVSVPSSRRRREGNSLPPSPHDRLIATIDDVSTGMIVERPRPTEFQSPTGSRVSSKIGQRFGGIAFPLAQAPARLKDAGRGGEAKTTSLPPVQVKPRPAAAAQVWHGLPRLERGRYSASAHASSSSSSVVLSIFSPSLPQHNIHDYRGHHLRRLIRLCVNGRTVGRTSDGR